MLSSIASILESSFLLFLTQIVCKTTIFYVEFCATDASSLARSDFIFNHVSCQFMVN